MKKMVMNVISWVFNPPYHVGKILVWSLLLFLLVWFIYGFCPVEVWYDGPNKFGPRTEWVWQHRWPWR